MPTCSRQKKRGNENIKTKRNFFAFKPLLTLEDSFNILRIFKTQSLNNESGFILNKILFLNWNILFGEKKNPKLEKKVENVLEQFFDPGKKPTYLQSHFTQSRAGDKRARWKLLKLARKYTVQEKAKICICLFLSSPCTLLWTSKWTKSPCFEETILRHLNRSRWDIIYFMIQRAEKKICLEQVLVLLNYDKWGCQRVNMAETWLTSCCCAW